jgi:hypothetical protein
MRLTKGDDHGAVLLLPRVPVRTVLFRQPRLPIQLLS